MYEIAELHAWVKLPSLLASEIVVYVEYLFKQTGSDKINNSNFLLPLARGQSYYS